MAQGNRVWAHNVYITKYEFTPVRSSVISLVRTRPDSRAGAGISGKTTCQIELNYTSHSCDMSLQKVVHFLGFFSFHTLAKMFHKT